MIPCLAEGVSAGRFVHLALDYSLGAGWKPDATCKFRREDCVDSRRDFIVGCPDALAAFAACVVTVRWFTPHFSVLASFCIRIGPPLRLHVLSRMLGVLIGMSLGFVPPDVVPALRDAVPGLVLMICGPIWSKSAEAGLFSACCRAGGPAEAGSSAFMEACFVFVVSVSEAELLVAGDLVSCIGLVKGLRLMCIVPSTLLTPLSHQYSSFVGVLSQSLMCLRVLGLMGLLSVGGRLC